MTRSGPRVWSGKPHPLGVTFDGRGVNVALFSAHAERVEFCLFEPTGQREIERIELPEYTDEVFHGYLPDLVPGQLYGFRVHGPYQPEAGHRFNPAKLLIDPYAKLLSGPFRWSNAYFGYRVGSPREDLSIDRRDTARSMPKGVVIDDAFQWGVERRPERRWEETVIYEAHVRGLTERHPELPHALRGTYAGLGHPAVVEHLKDLGVTALELLPVHAIADERPLLQRGLTNYWGYSSLGYFAPELRYARDRDSVREFKTMVARLHEAGIEVILDVVYNHTGEGNQLGPTLCFRGIDNASYYKLVKDQPRYYYDVSGCGNTLDLTHPRVLQFVMDSLRYWVEVMHVDGFRFDLATALAREEDGFDAGSGFLDAVRQDPVLAKAKLIAEPWDVGPGGYRVGGFGPSWAEWNDRFRDTVRAFWRGDERLTPEFATRFLGSTDIFERRGRRPWASLNFVTAHDGFTLHDLVSYSRKHNHANGEDNRDGHGHNLSWNCGHEGPTQSPAIQALRQRQKRNMLATLLLAQGTPMLLAGDELGNSQSGNNNAYCQDNEIAWLPWPELDADDRALIRFTARVMQLRREHPIFRRLRFLHGRERSPGGVRDVTWLNDDGAPMQESDWLDPHRRTLAVMLCGAAAPPAVAVSEAEGVGETFLVLFNAASEEYLIRLPAVPGVMSWRRMLDTVDPDLGPGGAAIGADASYRLAARSLAVLMATAEAAPDHDVVETSRHAMPFGAEPLRRGGVRFRLWVPDRGAVDLVLGTGAEAAVLAMEARGAGWFELWSEAAAPGVAYAFRLDGDVTVPDPASRGQAQDVLGPSLVVDAAAYRWRESVWRGRPWHEAVILEVHVGTATPEGTFDALKAKLPQWAELGITALELMPVAAFAGTRNWGYDTVLPFAPAPPYGTPDQLKAFVDEAHRHGLMVFLDVVYTHWGPAGDGPPPFARPFFRDDVATPWGPAIDYRRRPVRDFIVHDALFWIEEYRLDGLRLDGARAIVDEETPDIVDELAAAVAERFGGHRYVHLMIESAPSDAARLDGAYRARWNVELSQALHTALTGDEDPDDARLAVDPIDHVGRGLAEGWAIGDDGELEALTGGAPGTALPPTRFIAYLQNHARIGARSAGARLTTKLAAEVLAAGQAVVLLAPQIPLLFMGEEWGATTPFHYFTDFGGALGQSVKRERRREFESFQDVDARTMPDPEAETTFARSRLDWQEAETPEARGRRAVVGELLALRARRIQPLLEDAPGGRGRFARIGAYGLEVRWELAGLRELVLLAQLGPEAGRGFSPPEGEALWLSTPHLQRELGQGRLPPWSVAWFLTEAPNP